MTSKPSWQIGFDRFDGNSKKLFESFLFYMKIHWTVVSAKKTKIYFWPFAYF